MVASARLLWLASQVHGGRQASVSFSFNGKTNREKVKFTLKPPQFGQCTAFRPCIMSALSAIQDAMLYSCVTDKGHTSSAGMTVVEFWVAQVCQTDATAMVSTSMSAPQVPMTMSPQVAFASAPVSSARLDPLRNIERPEDAFCSDNVLQLATEHTAVRHVSFGGRTYQEYECNEQEESASSQERHSDIDSEDYYDSDTAYDPL